MSKKRHILNCPKGSSGGSVFNSVYVMKPINRLATHGLSGEDEKDLVGHVKPPILINTDKLPDNSAEMVKWMARHKKEILQGQCAAATEGQRNDGDAEVKTNGGRCVETLKKLSLATRFGLSGEPVGYTVMGCWGRGDGGSFPLRYVREFSSRMDCCQFLEEFVVRRRAECAIVLLARILGVKPTHKIEEAVSENDLAFYYPVESRKRSAQ